MQFFYNLLSLSLWAIGIAQQISGDFSDPEHISHRPWYLSRDCSCSWEETRSFCRIAQASFAMSILALTLCCGRLIVQAGLTLYAYMKEQKLPKDEASWEHELDGRFCDTEHLLPPERLDPAPYYNDALSPVLAFFPEESARSHSLNDI